MSATKPRKAASANAAYDAFGLSKKQLAETIGLAPEALYKTNRLNAAKISRA